MTINTPTHVTEIMATFIDQIITNTPAQCYSTDVISLFSDHYAQCNTINITVPQQIRCYEFRNASEAKNIRRKMKIGLV
jgi:hypothetical protein